MTSTFSPLPPPASLAPGTAVVAILPIGWGRGGVPLCAVVEAVTPARVKVRIDTPRGPVYRWLAHANVRAAGERVGKYGERP